MDETAYPALSGLALRFALEEFQRGEALLRWLEATRPQQAPAGGLVRFERFTGED